MSVDDTSTHVWTGAHAQAANVLDAYQTAVTAAGRGDGYRPFTQLRRLVAAMCWCTPPAVWHALLLLLRWAVRLRGVSQLSSNDPLVVAALGYLPSLTALSSECAWPHSFVAMMTQKRVQTGEFRYLAPHTTRGWQRSDCLAPKTAFRLTDGAGQRDRTPNTVPLCLTPHSSPATSAHSVPSSRQYWRVGRRRLPGWRRAVHCERW